MSHSLHRMGSVEDLQNDFTIVIRPEKGVNDIGSRESLRKILRAFHDTGAVNITSARGEGYRGNLHMCSIEDIIEGVGEGKAIFAAYDSAENLEKFLRFAVDGNFGLSMVVQGLCENVNKILDKVGLRLHTINNSIGVWGKTDKLPERHILEINTMCGHGMVSFYLIQDVIESVRKGKISVREGAIKLAQPCVCGIFNTTRAENIIRKLI